MLIRKLIIGLLSFYTVEIKRSSFREIQTIDSNVSLEWSYETKKQKEKKKVRYYDKSKWKKQKTYHRKELKFKGTKSKDVRFSNQKSIRRMFRNS